MKPRLLFTPGDPNGIGSECLIRAWGSVVERCRPVVVGGRKALLAAAEVLEKQLRLVPVDSPASVDELPLLELPGVDYEPTWGLLDSEAGRVSFAWLEEAVELLLAGNSDGLVTGPINKAAWALAGVPHAGHTGYLAEKAGVAGQEVMAFTSERLKVALATTHIPLSQVEESLTDERLRRVITLFAEFLQQPDRPKPLLAVCGLNPHAGDGGVIGSFEEQRLKPLLDELRQEGYRLDGPLAADTVFTTAALERCDGMVALYHDQGLIPLKHLAFDTAVNITLGLPFVRTSPDHGTAFDIAGKGIASQKSLLAAVDAAVSTLHPFIAEQNNLSPFHKEK